MNQSIMRWAVLAAVILTFSVASFGQVAIGVSVRIGPPPLPVYAQPICPGPGYIWTPGYWAWDDDDGYYWVPGTWVLAPVGMYWTPGYWGWGNGFYIWHAGYWGPHVGFYGGINYGYGYTGVGFYGGEWRHGRYFYNRSVTNVSVTNVTNVYNRTVIVHNRSMASFNGGHGGIQARPSRDEERWSRERHSAPLAVQSQHERAAAGNRENLASRNHGRPVIAATSRPGDFGRRSAVSARAAGGEYRAPAMSPREARVNPGGANRGNAGPGNRRNPNAGNRSNEGFRPFTPPARNNAGNTRENSNRNPGGNFNRGNENNNRNPGGSVSRGNENRPFTPPSRNDAGNVRNNNNNRNRGGDFNRGNDRQFNQNRPPQQQREMAPPRPAPRPATPRSGPQQQRSSPPPHASPAPRFNPPPTQHRAPQQSPHRDRGR